jgi:hypothetical protein
MNRIDQPPRPVTSLPPLGQLPPQSQGSLPPLTHWKFGANRSQYDS